MKHTLVWNIGFNNEAGLNKQLFVQIYKINQRIKIQKVSKIDFLKEKMKSQFEMNFVALF